MSEPTPAPEVRHCWVDAPTGRTAGLVLKWERRTEHGVWEGYVAYAKWRTDREEWALVTEWLPAGMLKPLE